MPNRDDRDRFRQAMYRRDVGDLGPVRIFLQVVDDLSELPGKEAVRIRQREQESLYVKPLRCRILAIGCDSSLMQSSLARERVDRMRIVPGTRRYRRVRQVAIDQHPG